MAGAKTMGAVAFDLLEAKDVDGLARYLSPAFVLQLHEVDGTRVRNARVIHALVTSDTVIEGQPVLSTSSPRLATYEWNGKRWQMTAYANFAPIT